MFMKGYINKVILLGNMGHPPEVRYLPNGNPVASFSLATNEGYFDKDSNWNDKTEWHNIVLWGKLAEACKDWKKGSKVYIEGKKQTQSWEGKDGEKKYRVEIVAQVAWVLDVEGKSSSDGKKRPPKKQPEPESFEEPEASDDDDEDVPF